MTSQAPRIESLVVRIQGDFLESPALRLTLADAERHFGTDALTCEAVLETLVDARVLARDSAGVYSRFFPRMAHAA